MDAAEELEVIHLLLSEEDRTELNHQLESHGVDVVSDVPREIALSLLEKYSRRAIIKDLKLLTDATRLTG